MNKRAMTEKEMLDLMIIEAQDELTKTKLTERMLQRARLKGHAQSMDQMLGNVQTKISRLKQTIFDLLTMREDASTGIPLVKELEK